jgi:hypothetical protein
MVLTDVTTTAEVRAVLGVSEKEIRDTVLLQPIYAVRLSEALYALDDGLLTAYTAASLASPQSALQLRFTNLVETYSAYRVAEFCLGAVAMFAPKEIKDSRSEVIRVNDPYAKLRGDIDEALVSLQALMLSVYALIDPSVPVVVATVRTMVAAAPLGTDPVTG